MPPELMRLMMSLCLAAVAGFAVNLAMILIRHGLTTWP